MKHTSRITGLSGNELYCLDKIGLRGGDIVVGNSVHSMGIVGSLVSGFRGIVGGEIHEFTELIEDGRKTALARMEAEAQAKGSVGITGVGSELVFHGGNIEFLSIGSALHSKNVPNETREQFQFSSSANGQELYTQIDSGYHPKHFVFGNVAYSIGLTSGILGSLKTLARGEIREFSDIFNTTRHLALQRIILDAQSRGANSVVGIETTILPFSASGAQEMLMIGTSAISENIAPGYVVTSDLTCQEMWNLNEMGYAPLQLVLGTSVYSLGLVGSFTSFFKSFVKGEIPELSKLIYDAREQSLGIIDEQAKQLGADEVVGVKTYVYQLGSGLIEFLAIGTAVKKVPGLKNRTDQLIPQAIIKDKDTFFNSVDMSFGVDLNNSDV